MCCMYNVPSNDRFLIVHCESCRRLRMLQLGYLGFMAGQASIENGKLGGRPLGRKNNATLEKELILERIRQRVYQSADLLADAQLSLARGTSFLFKADTDDDGKARKPNRCDRVKSYSDVGRQ